MLLLEFVAPAYTPMLWLAGLFLIRDRLVPTRISYQKWMFGLVAILFVVFPVLHALEGSAGYFHDMLFSRDLILVSLCLLLSLPGCVGA